MSNLTILRRYAQLPDPEATLPKSILFSHTPTSLTVFDAYPKAKFHFLILPRVQAPLTIANLTNLQSLLRCDKALAKEVILGLKKDAEALKQEIEAQMIKIFGFSWRVQIGFHPTPSMEHLHLHVISDDFCSPSLKTKRHYNSFSKTAHFFLPIDDLLDWFDAVPEIFKFNAQLRKSQYESLLKEDLICCHCDNPYKTMPALKEHLQEEFDKRAKRDKPRQERKRKREAELSQSTSQGTSQGTSQSTSQGTSQVSDDLPKDAKSRKTDTVDTAVDD